MASFIYDLGRQSYLIAQINMSSDNIKVAIVTSGYTPNSATDQFLSTVTNIIGTSGNLANKTTTAGVFDADDISVTSVTGTAAALVLYQDTGSSATSRLIAYIDSVTGFPATVTGATITLQWSAGANKIFKL